MTKSTYGLLTLCLCACLLCAGCTSRPTHAERVDALPKIYPDYAGVTIPAEIAPLNFCFTGGSYTSLFLSVEGSKGGTLTAAGRDLDMDLDEWHALTRRNRGGRLTFTLFVKASGAWRQYRPFEVEVSPDSLDAWGLTYRRIAPGYEVYGRMGIYERDLSNFDERPVFENTLVPGACVNCHTANRTRPDQLTLHIRGDHGATMVQREGRREWLKARNDSLHGSMVYPYWHPSGRYCAYSTNATHQSFHAVRSKRIEVFDQSSDVFVYCPDTHELLLAPQLMTADHYETYPVFSPDGRTLYFCSSRAEPIPARYREVRYNICRVSFDPATGRFGSRVDTLFNARVLGKSATHPRPSYDGRFLMFTMSDYGCFPIWHREADNWLLDLSTGRARPMTAANSPDTDSWHNWSANSRWVVFTSRRGDGLYTRLYIAHIDRRGRVSKPFLLPQRRPGEYYDRLLDSYNTPDFTSRPVAFDAHAAAREIVGDRRVETRVR